MDFIVFVVFIDSISINLIYSSSDIIIIFSSAVKVKSPILLPIVILFDSLVSTLNISITFFA
uniref:Uncharacterized protein n=1 Tax=Moumouvirus sp. 'Monve' TaxID=1128131 RepID=H2EFE4_9VIRU|nr:hypothetical protein mv_R1007 [Moumouvirus Monve]